MMSLRNVPENISNRPKLIVHTVIVEKQWSVCVFMPVCGSLLLVIALKGKITLFEWGQMDCSCCLKYILFR